MLRDRMNFDFGILTADRLGIPYNDPDFNFDVDGNGNLVVDHVDSNNQWTFNPDGTLATNALEAGSATVSERALDYFGEEIGVDSDASGGELSIDNIPGGGLTYYLKVEYRFGTGTSDVTLRFNDDVDGNSNYIVWDEQGTRSTGNDEILCVDTSSFGQGCFWAKIQRDRGSRRLGVSFDHQPGSNVNGFAQSATRNETSSDLEKITMKPASGSSIEGQEGSRMRLWRVR